MMYLSTLRTFDAFSILSLIMRSYTMELCGCRQENPTNVWLKKQNADKTNMQIHYMLSRNKNKSSPADLKNMAHNEIISAGHVNSVIIALTQLFISLNFSIGSLFTGQLRHTQTHTYCGHGGEAGFWSLMALDGLLCMSHPMKLFVVERCDAELSQHWSS